MHGKTLLNVCLTTAGLLAGVLACSEAQAVPVYMVAGSGEVRAFTGVGVGETPMAGNNLAGGELVTTNATYGTYQGFTQTPDGTVYGVNSDGGVDSWGSLGSWLAGDSAVSLAAAGTYGAGNGAGSVHGISYDGNTDGFYVTYEGGPDIDGDVGEYATLADFLGNTNATVTAAPYGGNVLNFYYPDEDAPGNRDPQVPGANYFQVAGNGQLEGWQDLAAYAADPNNRTFQVGGYGAAAGFAALAPVPEPAGVALLALGGLALINRRRKA